MDDLVDDARERIEKVRGLIHGGSRATSRRFSAALGSKLRHPAGARLFRADAYLRSRLAGVAPHKVARWTALNRNGSPRKGSSGFRRGGVYKAGLIRGGSAKTLRRLSSPKAIRRAADKQPGGALHPSNLVRAQRYLRYRIKRKPLERYLATRRPGGAVASRFKGYLEARQSRNYVRKTIAKARMMLQRVSPKQRRTAAINRRFVAQQQPSRERAAHAMQRIGRGHNFSPERIKTKGRSPIGNRSEAANAARLYRNYGQRGKGANASAKGDATVRHLQRAARVRAADLLHRQIPKTRGDGTHLFGRASPYKRTLLGRLKRVRKGKYR